MKFSIRVCVIFLLFIMVSGVAYSEVTLRLLDTRLSEDPSRSTLTSIVKDFMKDNPNIKVELESVKSSDMLTKFLVASEVKQAPDVVYLYAGMLTRTVKQGYLLELDSYAASEGPEFLKKLYPMAIDAVSYKNKLYALPTIISIYGFWVNRDSLRELNIDEKNPPKTWDEFLEVCKKLTRARSKSSVDQWAFAMVGRTRSAVQRLAPWFFTNDVRLLNEDHTVFLPERDRAKESFRFFVELYTKNKVVPPGPTSVGAADMRIMFANETVNMTYDGPYAAKFHLRENPKMTPDRQVVWPFPAQRKRADFASVNWLGISSETKHPKEAWRLVTYLTNRESSIRFTKATGFLSANVPANESPEVQSNHLLAGFIRNIPNGVIFPEHPKFPQIGDLIVQSLQDALIGKKIPEEAFEELVSKADQLLKE